MWNKKLQHQQYFKLYIIFDFPIFRFRACLMNASCAQNLIYVFNYARHFEFYVANWIFGISSPLSLRVNFGASTTMWTIVSLICWATITDAHFTSNLTKNKNDFTRSYNYLNCKSDNIVYRLI